MWSDEVCPSYKENERLISGEGEKEEKKRRKSRWEIPADLLVTKAKALLLSQSITVEWQQ